MRDFTVLLCISGIQALFRKQTQRYLIKHLVELFLIAPILLYLIVEYLYNDDHFSPESSTVDCPSLVARIRIKGKLCCWFTHDDF